MARCSQCRTTILFGGKNEGDVRFCGEPCRAKHVLLNVAGQCPPELLASETAAVHAGACPICKGAGPVDVHMHHSVISIVAASFWKNQQIVACRSCARKRQLRDTLVSAVLGWWGFPHGLVMTPIQIGRNIKGMVGGPDPSRPSERLVGVVRLKLANSALVNARNEAVDASSPPATGAATAKRAAALAQN